MAKEDLIAALDEIHRAELTATFEFLAHASELRNMGAVRLAETMQAEAGEELAHAGIIGDRIYFLGGRPTYTTLAETHPTDNLVDVVERIVTMEMGAIARLNRAISICHAENDAGTRVMLEAILIDEETHLSEAQLMLGQIESMGPQGYLMCICGGGVPGATHRSVSG